MTRSWPVIGVILAILWLFIRGVTIEPLTIAGELIIGLLFGMPIAFMFRRMYVPQVSLFRILQITPYIIIYIIIFIKDLIVANIDVAYRVLAPSMPIEPDVVIVPLRVETNAAITTIANSITLTPGTLTIDYDEKYNALYVHAIIGKDRRDTVIKPIHTWEKYALIIFNEKRKPSDPIPNISINQFDDNNDN